MGRRGGPLVPEGMPVLVDDDLLFEDWPGCPRPAAVVNRWLRELPACGVPAPRSWAAYARAVKDWVEFLYVTLDRAAAVEGFRWQPLARWGPPLLVSEPGNRGGRVNGVRRGWDSLTPGERRRLVAPDGGSCLLAVRSGGGPFTAWATVLERASDRIRARFEPRFPHVHPHRLRHSFAMATLERLVDGHYRRAAEIVAATGGQAGPDAALALYVSKADPLLVLRDLMGHSSVTTTEAYLRRLDTTRIFGEAYARAGLAVGPAADAEAAAEFAADPGEVS